MGLVGSCLNTKVCTDNSGDDAEGGSRNCDSRRLVATSIELYEGEGSKAADNDHAHDDGQKAANCLKALGRWSGLRWGCGLVPTVSGRACSSEGPAREFYSEKRQSEDERDHT